MSSKKKRFSKTKKKNLFSPNRWKTPFLWVSEEKTFFWPSVIYQKSDIVKSWFFSFFFFSFFCWIFFYFFIFFYIELEWRWAAENHFKHMLDYHMVKFQKKKSFENIIFWTQHFCVFFENGHIQMIWVFTKANNQKSIQYGKNISFSKTQRKSVF